ncbi:MAG: 30S ribosomal protein S15 [Candidatus Omnitrophota bacterium]|nr:30S ribosomal protein S15 [Candidatus Omnitrophota bacterium]
MSLSKEEKEQVIKDYRGDEKDTGSSSVQIALLTKRINDLSEHFKLHKKDHHSRYGLLKLVSQRRKLSNYLKKKNPTQYADVIKKLGLRR